MAEGHLRQAFAALIRASADSADTANMRKPGSFTSLGDLHAVLPLLTTELSPCLTRLALHTQDAVRLLSVRLRTAGDSDYIGQDGKIQFIDKAVKPATSAEDMAAKLGELNTAKH